MDNNIADIKFRAHLPSWFWNNSNSHQFYCLKVSFNLLPQSPLCSCFQEISTDLFMHFLFFFCHLRCVSSAKYFHSFKMSLNHNLCRYIAYLQMSFILCIGFWCTKVLFMLCSNKIQQHQICTGCSIIGCFLYSLKCDQLTAFLPNPVSAFFITLPLYLNRYMTNECGHVVA